MGTGKKEILYVDDNLLNLELFHDQFSNKYDVFTAATGKEGLETLKNQDIDLIISDLMMPEMSGIEFLTLAMKLNDAPRIMLTAYSDINEITKAINTCKIYHFIQKPWDRKQLSLIIDQALDYNRVNRVNRELNEELRELTKQQKSEIKEKQLLLERLAKSEEQFRTIYENAVVGFYRTNPDGEMLMANDVLIKMLGYESLDELKKRKLLYMGYQAPEARAIFVDLISNKGKVVDLEGVWLKKNNSEIYISESAKAIRDETGNIKYYEGTVIDISERKRSEKELRRNEARLRDAQKIAHIGHLTINHIANEIEASDEIFRIFGLNVQTKLSDLQVLFNCIHREDRGLVIRSYKESINNKTKLNITYRVVKKKKEIGYIRTQSRTNYNAAGEPRLTFGTSQDITEQIITQQALMKEMEISNNTINSLPGVFYIFNKEGGFYRWNGQLERVTQFTNDEIKALNVFDLFPDNEKENVKQKIRDVFEKGQNYFEANIQSKTGENIPYLLTGNIIDINDVPHMVGMGIDISERVKMEKTLRENEEVLIKAQKLMAKEKYLMDVLMENITDKIYFKDKESRFIRVSKSMPKEFGLQSINEIIGKTDFDFYDIEHASEAFADEQEIMKTGKSLSDYLEKEILFDGSIKWASSTKMPLYNRNNNIIGTFGISRDVTEIKEMELKAQSQTEKLRKSEAELNQYREHLEELVNIRTREVGKLTQALEQNPATIIITDIKGNIEYVNAGFTVNSGYLATEALGKNPELLNSAKLPEKVYQNMWNTILSGKNWNKEILNRKKSGEEYWVRTSISPLFNQQGNIESFVIVQYDITEIKLANDELNERKQYLQMLRDESPVGLVLCKLDGEIIEVNKAFVNIIGYTIEEPLKLSFWEIIPGKNEKQQEEVLTNLQKTGRYGPTETEYLHKNRQLVPVRLSGLFIERNGETYIWSSIVDITAQKKFEKDLDMARIEAESANKAKSEFLANMSHEIRTPMNAVLGIADVLYQQVTNDVLRDYVSTIQSSGKSLLILIDDILDLSKIEAGKLEINKKLTNLYILLRDVVNIIDIKAKDKGLKVLFEYDENLPPVIKIDETRLRQVLINLLSNAVKFTNEGFVRIAVTLIGNKIIKQNNIDIKIEVEDSGIGIEPNFASQIFDSFTQQEGQDARKYGGSGLGLAISSRLIKLMNGEIQFKSKKGKGTTFSIILKKNEYALGNTTMVQGENRKVISKQGFEKSTILIVDDITENRIFLSGVFQGSKIKIVEASNGLDALELIKKEKPDLIITDLIMPKMDGFQLSIEVKKMTKGKTIPIIANSAAVMNFSKAQIDNAAFDVFLPKPIPMQDLYNLLAKYLPYSNPQEEIKQITDNVKETLPKAELIEFLGTLEDIKNDNWLKLQQQQPIEEVELFMKSLKALGEKYNSLTLINFSLQLQNSLNSFDIDAMLLLIRNFPMVVDEYKKRIKEV